MAHGEDTWASHRLPCFAQDRGYRPFPVGQGRGHFGEGHGDYAAEIVRERAASYARPLRRAAASVAD